MSIGNANATAHLDGVTITKLNINKSLGNYVFIRTSQTPTVIGCHQDNNWNLVLKLETELDNKIYAGLLAAHVSQSLVGLDGTGTCAPYGIENLQNFSIYK